MKNNVSKGKRILYVILYVLYIITAVGLLTDLLYFLGENVWKTELLPESAWGLLDSVYHSEGGPIFAMAFGIVFVLIAIVFAIVFRKYVSKTTTGLVCTTVVPFLLVYAVTMLLSVLSVSMLTLAIVVTPFCVVAAAHTVAAIVFLGKEIKK